MSLKRKAPLVSSPTTPPSPTASYSRKLTTPASSSGLSVANLTFEQRGQIIAALLNNATCGATTKQICKQVVEEPRRRAQLALDDSVKSLRSRIRTVAKKVGEEAKKAQEEGSERVVPDGSGEVPTPSFASALLPLIPLVASLPTDHPLPVSPSALSASTELLLYLFSQLPKSSLASLDSLVAADKDFISQLDDALSALFTVRADQEGAHFDAEQELLELESKGPAAKRLLLKSVARLGGSSGGGLSKLKLKQD